MTAFYDLPVISLWCESLMMHIPVIMDSQSQPIGTINSTGYKIPYIYNYTYAMALTYHKNV